MTKEEMLKKISKLSQDQKEFLKREIKKQTSKDPETSCSVKEDKETRAEKSKNQI